MSLENGPQNSDFTSSQSRRRMTKVRGDKSPMRIREFFFSFSPLHSFYFVIFLFNCKRIISPVVQTLEQLEVRPSQAVIHRNST